MSDDHRQFHFRYVRPPEDIAVKTELKGDILIPGRGPGVLRNFILADKSSARPRALLIPGPSARDGSTVSGPNRGATSDGIKRPKASNALRGIEKRQG